MALVEPDETPSGPANTIDQEKPKKESCVKYLDALWFCYSPINQFREFYCNGEVDSCFGHWASFTNCLKQRTKFADQVPQGAPERKHPIWTLRTKEQATAFWKAEFEGVRSSEEGELTTLHDGAGNATIKEDVQGKPPAV